MKSIPLILTVLIFSISFGQNDSINELHHEEIIEKKIYELPAIYDYKVFDAKGKLISEGKGQFIDYTKYKFGKYFINYNGQTKTLSNENPAIINESGKNIKNYSFLSLLALVTLLFFFLVVFRNRIKRVKEEQLKLLNEIKNLKAVPIYNSSKDFINTQKNTLDRNIIEAKVGSKLNESDWKIINQLIEQPSISNKNLAEQISLSVEGTRSALKKMYRIFEIPSSGNMRLALIIKIVQISK